ncbi:hypothetical protein DFH08DRAFT_730806 [Mycena albidolilacea]|uniref:BHLH domain-containing protein n=1 Tax=Mycena albidolilacea TaxID=1033008 RepID=A0AAD7AP07_9AGAR|nr:hypothetical protein DFH08DRAFT_730806 [Mycena albidolilacea]
MALLSKTESSSFNSFLDHALDSMDYEVSREWAMYSQHPDPEQYHDKNALTKATKDLMALDARGYAQQQQQQYYYPQHPQQHHQQLPNYAHYDYHPGPVYTRQPTFPFLHQQRPPPPPPHPLTMNYSPQRQYIATPSTASTSSSSFTFPPDLPPSPVVRRPSPKHTQSAPAAPPPPTKRPRTAPPPVKPALLSPSQKKANHIQSEQKRRANIRRGYEALCDVVPALRDAIREEEALSAVQHPPPTANGTGTAKGKRGRGRGRQDESGEKVDGRAGPRSENIVLSKSIDYMNDLLADRDALRARLDRARSVLPPGHPARTPLYADPLWEREWKGGVGHADEEAEDEDDDSS